MAKAKTAANTSTEIVVPEGSSIGDMLAQVQNVQEASNADRNFKDVNPDIRWYSWKVDNKLNAPLQGIVAEKRLRKNRETGHDENFYVIGLTQPAVVVDGTGDNRAFVMAKPGDFVAVGEIFALRTLEKYLPQGAKDDNGVLGFMAASEVVIKPIGQRDIGGGKKVWNVKITAEPVQVLPGTPLMAPHLNAPPPMLSSGEDDIPF